MEAFQYNKLYDYSLHPEIQIGEMIYECKKCQALKFKNESKNMCCSDGKVNLTPLIEPPKPLCEYVSGNTQQSKHFLRNIRKYNATFQMTSFGASKILNADQYLQTFKIQGM